MKTRRLAEPETGIVRDTTLEGFGIAEVDGQRLFIAGALAGETVRFRRSGRKKKVEYAELLEIIHPSASRTEPPCTNYLVCGGCALQHLAADAQLELKQAALVQALARIGRVTPGELLPPLAGSPLGYRRRARLGARFVAKKGRVLVGFRERRSSYIADMQSCETLQPELSLLIPALAVLLGELSIRAQVPQIELSMGDNAVSLVIRVLAPPSAADREKLLAFGLAHAVQIRLQSGGPDSLELLGSAEGVPELYYRLPDYDLELRFGPLDFIQVNQDMNRRMIAQAIKLADPRPGERVLDLYCGIGNFALPLARHTNHVIGVEIDPQMVDRARANARLNNLDTAEFYAADLARVDTVPEWWGSGFDLVVLDPPRAGALEILGRIAATGARRILYVSCHAGSLARDAGILCRDFGYHLSSAGAMDMFPQTAHVEAMALFERAE